MATRHHKNRLSWSRGSGAGLGWVGNIGNQLMGGLQASCTSDPYIGSLFHGVVVDGCAADGCCTVVQVAAEQHPDLRLALGDWSVAKSQGTEHPDWRLAEGLFAVQESVSRCLGRGTFSDIQ
jgi:hypothetical protein